MQPFQRHQTASTRTKCSALLIFVSVLPLAIGTGCGGSMGKLRSEEVTAAIGAAEASVYTARTAELASTAKPSLARAESKLQEAHQASSSKRGIQALRAAQEARLEAQHALSLDAQADVFSELLAQERDRSLSLTNELERARRESEAARTATEEIRNELARLGSSLDELDQRYRQELDTTVAEKQEANARAQAFESQLNETENRIGEMTRLLEDARTRQAQAERQVQGIASEIEKARSDVREAQKVAVRRTEETQGVKKQAKELAEAYSERIDVLQRQQQQDTAVEKAREDARRRVPTANVSAAEMQAARPVVLAWKQAWDRGDMTAHLGYYAPDARGERTAVVLGRESRGTTYSRAQLVGQIRAVPRGDWQEAAQASVAAEGSDVVGQVTYRRKDANVASPDSLDFWMRKSYWQKRGADWQIVREKWRFYNDVPNFPRR